MSRYLFVGGPLDGEWRKYPKPGQYTLRRVPVGDGFTFLVFMAHVELSDLTAALRLLRHYRPKHTQENDDAGQERIPRRAGVAAASSR